MVAGMAQLALAPPEFALGTESILYYNQWLTNASNLLEQQLISLQQQWPNATIIFVPVIPAETQKYFSGEYTLAQQTVPCVCNPSSDPLQCNQQNSFSTVTLEQLTNPEVANSQMPSAQVNSTGTMPQNSDEYTMVSTG